MKLNKLKRTLAAFLSFVLILTLTSITPLAAQGTLGTEQPHLSCTFTDSEGRAVDGNALSAGDYTVSFTLSGMQSFAVMQYTMSYDAAVLTVNGHSDLLSDRLPDQLRGLGAAGVLVQNGTINFGFITRVDQTATTTAIDAAGQLLLKLQVTVTTDAPVDFAKIVTLDTDPNQTFIEADYADYADYGTADQDCYALVTAFDGYTATLSYAYGYDRDIKIMVADGDVDLGTYGMVVCNFKKDATIDASDYSAYKRATGKSSSDDAYNAACDFNHDGNIDATDYSIYKAFTGKNLNNDIYANA